MENRSLFQEGYIGRLRLKNRIVMAPMNVGGNNDSDGCLSERGINYFVERAKGGTGLIVTGAVRTNREFERNPKTIPQWMLMADYILHSKWISELSERCHDYGTKVAIQLTPGGGRTAGPFLQRNGFAIGPSANPCFLPPHIETRPLTKEEIKKIVDYFEASSAIVKNAGADAIEIHGHQGYLIDQFSTALWNHRTDEYGGSLENRLRFSKELIEAIRRGAGKDFPIIYRFGLTHYMDGGRTIEEGLEMAKLLESYGVDALDIDSGCYEQNYLPHPPTTIPCGTFAVLAEKVKGVVSIPVITSTRVGYPEVAEKILSNGQADYVCVGRPLIADPQWANKAKKGDSVRPCLACHEGCLRRLGYNKPLSCAVNPLAGNEEYLKLEQAHTQKNICVIGGGVAGMVAAITCAMRGHNVTLYEQNDELGGNFRKRFVPSFKSDYSRYIEYLKEKIARSSVKVYLNTNVEPQLLYNKGYDVLVNAVGAHFKEIKIDGIESSTLLPPMSLYEDKDFNRYNLVIIGGGLVGAEAALNVANHGGNVTIVEMTETIASAAQRVNQQHLLVLLKEKGVKCLTNTKVEKAVNNKLVCKKAEDVIELPFTHISQCVGMEPTKLNLSEFDDVITVGDADHSGIVLDSVWSAYRQCRLI